jgi:hypothetical protein
VVLDVEGVWEVDLAMNQVVMIPAFLRGGI